MGVEGFDADSTLVQFFDGFEGVDGGSFEPVESGDDDGVALPCVFFGLF